MGVTVYDGRTATVDVVIATGEPATLTVTATATDGAETEIVPGTAANKDGLWHGTLLVRPGYALKGGESRLTVSFTNGGGQSQTLPIALDVHKIGWQRRITWSPPTGPEPREHGAFLYDPGGRAAYLLQGSGYTPQFKPLGDAWRLDLASGTWTEWKPTGDVPVAGGSRRVAAVPGSRQLYAYGGYIRFDTTAKDDDTLFRVDLGGAARTFTRLNAVGVVAPARELHALAYARRASSSWSSAASPSAQPLLSL